MKQITSLIISSFYLVLFVNAQSPLPPCMIEVNGISFSFDYQAQQKNVRVSSHFMGEYVESNYQYQQYLNFLIDNRMGTFMRLAAPDKSIWDSLGLHEADVTYLKKNYWTAEEFKDYPVLGLNYEQATLYFQWKTNRLNVAFLVKNKEMTMEEAVNKGFSDEEYVMQNLLIKSRHTFFPNFRLPAFIESIASIKAIEKVEWQKKKVTKFEKWLMKTPEFSYLTYRPLAISQPSTTYQQKLNAVGIYRVNHTWFKSFLSNTNSNNFHEMLIDRTSHLDYIASEEYNKIQGKSYSQRVKDFKRLLKNGEYKDFKLKSAPTRAATDYHGVKITSNHGNLDKIITKKGHPLTVIRMYMTNTNSKIRLRSLDE